MSAEGMTFAIAHTAEDFERWVANSEPGDICEYASGKHLFVPDSTGEPDRPTWRTSVAELAWRLGPAILTAETDKTSVKRGHGVVELVQRKISPREYSYLAIRRQRKGARG